MKTFLLTALLLSCSLSAGAASMYVCTDAKGNKTYTQDPSARCQAINLGRPAIYSSANTSQVSNPVSHTEMAESTTMSETPSMATPSATDTEQIATLQRKLAEAQKALAEGKLVRYGNERNYAKYLERIAGLEKNVKQIEAELAKAQGKNTSSSN